MPFAGYEDFDECVRKNRDKKDPKAYCAEIKRKTEKSVQSVDVFEEDESDTPAIDKVVDKFAKGGPGSGQKGHKTSDLRRHSQYTSSDYSALKKKGYTDKEIGSIWDKDKKSGKKPLHRKEIPKMDEAIKAKKLSERLKSKSTSKTPAIDALIQKGGPGSGIKGHTTAKELAIKKRLDALDKARDAADALADKDIKAGQQMINKAEKESKKIFDEMMDLGHQFREPGVEAKLNKLEKKRDTLAESSDKGWKLRIKGQNRQSKISEKYHNAVMKVIHSSSKSEPSTEVLTGRMGEGVTGVAGEGVTGKIGEPPSKQSQLKATRDKRQEELDLLQKEYHIIDAARRESWNKYFGEHPLSDPKSYGTNDPKDKERTLKLGEDRDKVSKLIEEKFKQVKKAEDALAKDVDKQRAKAEKTKGESKPSGKVQLTLTQDAPKHTPKSNLLATKHAEAAVKRGTLFKELGKKSKKELKGMIQQDSKVDMAESLKQMTKSDMKYHITSGKHPSPKGSEEAYNALTKQERKGLLKPIPDPKTPKAKGSEPPKRRNAPSIKAIQVEGVDAYESTHGKKPRGTGLWMFQIGEDSGNTYSAETSFKEAQKQAKKQAQKEMKRSVKLLP